MLHSATAGSKADLGVLIAGDCRACFSLPETLQVSGLVRSSWKSVFFPGQAWRSSGMLPEMMAKPVKDCVTLHDDRDAT